MKLKDEHDDQAFVDALFVELPKAQPSAELCRLVAEIPAQNPRPARAVWPFRSIWQPTLALAAAACIGFFSGQSIMQLRTDNAPGVTASIDDELSSSEDSLENGTSLDGASANADGSNELSAADSELERLLILATATDFGAEDWSDTFQASSRSEDLQEETF